MSRHKKGHHLIFAKRALLAFGWAENVRLTIEHGRIAKILIDTAAKNTDVAVDTLLPALSNVHSHSFQRAMAGMTEVRAKGQDSFWTWRELMYRFIDRLTPDHIEAVAALAFLEMQEAGYAAVGEFHYVHHHQGGVPYANAAELSNRIFAAAATTGIGLTHLPVLYSYGGAGQIPLNSMQLRFGNTTDEFLSLVERAREGLAYLPADARMGVAPHSLRATSPDDLENLVRLVGKEPIHMHISEQLKEVQDIENWLGARPVTWLLDNVDVNARWCLIHATHMTGNESKDLAASGAVVGLCPATESNLGDGVFNGVTYLNAGGAFGIGSDSNVNISLVEELRTLEYSQRLRDCSRNIMVVGEGSVGHALYSGAACGGAQALGRHAGAIGVGYLADLVAIDSTAPSLCALRSDQILDGLVFAAKDTVITDLWSAGRHAVQGGRHVARDLVVARYRSAIKTLLST